MSPGIDAAAVLAARATERLRPGATAVVAVAGPVAVGKSTLAELLAAGVRARGLGAEVVSTDGFLLPGAELAARGLTERKGFPESYDVAALRAFCAAVRDTLDRVDPVAVPVYSHETYDVLPGVHHAVAPTDVVVLEGVNALSATTGCTDLGVYVDAPLGLIEQWYVERFLRLVAAAGAAGVTGGGSFYDRFTGLAVDAQADIARSVYRSVNLPNLTEHIAPSRDLAEVVVVKGADHEWAEIVDRGAAP